MRMTRIRSLCRGASAESWWSRQVGGTELLFADRLMLCRGARDERAGASGGINTRSHSAFCSDLEPFTSDRRAQSSAFKLLGLKSGFIFTHILSAAASHRGVDLRCPVYVISLCVRVDCWLERRCASWTEGNRGVTGGNRTGVSGGCWVQSEVELNTPQTQSVPADACLLTAIQVQWMFVRGLIPRSNSSN